jgi:hypothetical protein
MANTMTLISSQTLASTAASVTFSSIVGTYTDLRLIYSARDNRSSTNFTDDVTIKFNGSATSDYSSKVLYGGGGGAASLGNSAATYSYGGYVTDTSGTANTFGSSDIYIPNYAGSNNKSFSVDAVSESNDANNVYISLQAGLRSNTAAITSITLAPLNGTLFSVSSTFYLYGINNS